MYIDDIDTMLDNTIDDFYERIVIGKKITLSKENDDDIVKIFIEYIKSVNFNDVKKLFTNNQHIQYVIDLFGKYIFNYIFITTGSQYSGKYDTFKTNLIDIIKNSKAFADKNNMFLSSDNTSNIFKLIEMTKDLSNYFNNKSKNKIDISESTNTFIKELGDNFLNAFINIYKSVKDDSMKLHNIIKLVLFKMNYIKYDKKEIIKLTEENMSSVGESIYIDIVIPFEKSIDIVEIESMMSEKDRDMGLAKNIYDIINKGELTFKQQLIKTNDEKINELLDSGLVIPLSEDFMLQHRSSEKYDSQKKTKEQRDGLRIRYILDKIESMENYNVTDKKPMDIIYLPLAYRLAITMNENEELKIISKLIKHGTSDINNNLNELLHYRKYPYLNFKSVSKNGFSYASDKTISVVRSISYNKTGDTRQQPHHQIQTRVCGNDDVINIVGFMLNTTNVPTECMTVKQLNTAENGYSSFLKTVSDYVLNGKKETIGWLFDLDKDASNIKTYEQSERVNKEETCKFMCAKLRDDIVDMIQQKISQVLKKHVGISFYDAYKLSNKIMNASMIIPQTDAKYNELEKVIYTTSYEKYIPKYDDNEDIIRGLYGEILELPTIREKPKKNLLKIHIQQEKYVKPSEYEESIGGVLCQHFVSWNKIVAQRKTEDSKYINLLYDFMQTYVIVNEDSDCVCKSCGSLLDIKKYVSDGEYDSATQKFIPYSIPLNVSLEDFPEYRRYNITIRNIDGLINKISENINIQYLVGSALTQKINRTTMVKDTIDLLLLNNSLLLKSNMKERRERATNMYGVNCDLSKLFAFELENSIFLYTPGKEKDFYKFVKHNNIVTYILFLILLELNENHISFLSSDKVCNFTSYSKFGEQLFSGIKIRINMSGDVEDVTKYPVFCYMVYVATCILSKYPIWYHETEVSNKKVNPVKQKIMIHTLFDTINCILENAANNMNKHIFETVNVKFNNKLRSLYSSKIIMDRLKSENIKYQPDFIKNVVKDFVKPIALPSEYDITKNIIDAPNYRKSLIPRYYSKTLKTSKYDQNVSNATHCNDGKLHKWKLFEKTLKCLNCGVVDLSNVLDEKLTDDIKNNANIRYLETVCDKYCLSGSKHSYARHETESKTIELVCKKCNYVFGKYISVSKMKEIDAITTNPKVMRYEQFVNTKQEKHDKFVSSIINSIKSNYSESKTHRDDYYKFIDKFVDKLQNLVGDTIKIDNNTIHLRNNMYIINHNHLGYPIEPPIYVDEHDNSLAFKKSHPFFKVDTISYTFGGASKIEVFYNAVTRVLLGYKEYNKDIIANKKISNKIMIEKSISDKIKHIGNKSEYIDVSLIGDIKDKNILLDVVASTSRDRIDNVKTIIYKLLVIINMIKYKKQLKHDEVKMDDNDTPEPLVNIEKYYRKLMGLITQNGDTKIFELWDLIIQNIHYQKVPIKKVDININDNNVHIDDIYNYDYSGNLILYYFIGELSKLLDINTNKIIKQTLVQFILEFIDASFNEFDVDHLINDNEIQRFICIIHSSEYFRELEGTNIGVNEYVKEILGDYTDPDHIKTKEEIEADADAKEESESMDVDGDIDAEDAYDSTFTDRLTASYIPIKWEHYDEKNFDR